MILSKRIRRKFFGPEGRAAIYAGAGVLLVYLVITGFIQAVQMGMYPPPPEIVKPAPPPKAERYIAPADLVFPFF